MKVAVSSTGKDTKSEVDARFGRCSYFILAEIENGKITRTESVENTCREQTGAAGITASQFVAEKGVKAVITGNVGPRAFDVFRQFGIDIYRAEGTVSGALSMFSEGKLEKMSVPTGPGFKGK
jgi:predicted Fe-Mo cluster-binding NifX family protein